MQPKPSCVNCFFVFLVFFHFLSGQAYHLCIFNALVQIFSFLGGICKKRPINELVLAQNLSKNVTDYLNQRTPKLDDDKYNEYSPMSSNFGMLLTWHQHLS